jgi:hypothetical protein
VLVDADLDDAPRRGRRVLIEDNAESFGTAGISPAHEAESMERDAARNQDQPPSWNGRNRFCTQSLRQHTQARDCLRFTVTHIQLC